MAGGSSTCPEDGLRAMSGGCGLRGHHGDNRVTDPSPTSSPPPPGPPACMLMNYLCGFDGEYIFQHLCSLTVLCKINIINRQIQFIPVTASLLSSVHCNVGIVTSIQMGTNCAVLILLTHDTALMRLMNQSHSFIRY